MPPPASTPPLPRPNVLSRRALLLSAFALLPACRAPGPSASRPVRRIVSLTPNTTEAVFALGAGGLVVGRSRFCDFPSEVTALPSVGGYVDPSFEAILALEPDLVVGARGPAGSGIAERLEHRGVRTWFPVTESIDGIVQMLRGMGERVDRVQRAQTLIQSIRARLDTVAAAVRQQPRPRTLLVFGLAPIVAAGPGSFPDEMLRHAGAINALQQGTRYPALGMETVLGIAPEIVIDAAVAEGHGRDRIRPDTPGWSQLEAVRKGRVIAIDDDAVLRPGPRVADGVARLAAALHPEVKT